MLILFMLPISVSALLGGLGPGLLATVASGGLTSYFLVPPVGRFAFAAGYDLVQWGLLLANGYWSA
jgi:two-component system sensor histidine kinase/response regulator